MRPHSTAGYETLLHSASCARLEELLDQRDGDPARCAEVDATIQKEFSTTRSVLALDMAGFSFSVRRNGIIHHLALIRKMQKIVDRVITARGGAVVKFEADNCYAVFQDTVSAVAASVEIHQTLKVENQRPGTQDAIEVSIGVGHGIILLGCDDFFGDEVNVACKLGEDVAEQGEVYLTTNAYQQLPAGQFEFEKVALSISGIQFDAYKLKH